MQWCGCRCSSDDGHAAQQALEAGGARKLRNESFFSAPQLKRDPLGSGRLDSMTHPSSPRSQFDRPNVLVLPPLLYGVALASGFLLQWVAPQPVLSSNARYWAGGVLLALGVLVAFWGRAVMERAGTNVNPTLPT